LSGNDIFASAIKRIKPLLKHKSIDKSKK